MGTRITISQFYAWVDEIIINLKNPKTDEELETMEIEQGLSGAISITLLDGEKYLISEKGEIIRAA